MGSELWCVDTAPILLFSTPFDRLILSYKGEVDLYCAVSTDCNNNTKDCIPKRGWVGVI